MAGVIALDKSVAEATENCEEENPDYKELIANDGTAKKVFLRAKNRLNKYYNIKMYTALLKRELRKEERPLLSKYDKDLVEMKMSDLCGERSKFKRAEAGHYYVRYMQSLAQVGIYARAQPYGGSNKSSKGHHYDTILFANGMINTGMSCQLIQYVHEEHDKFMRKGIRIINLKFDNYCNNSGERKLDEGRGAGHDGGQR
eukprot:16434410-Heterocapsa_arctica.AAC.1